MGQFLDVHPQCMLAAVPAAFGIQLMSEATIMYEGLVVSAYDPPFICFSRLVMLCAEVWAYCCPREALAMRVPCKTLIKHFNGLRGEVPDGRAAFPWRLHATAVPNHTILPGPPADQSQRCSMSPVYS